MTVFEDYADYYDLIYETKDYAAEAEFISGLIKANQPRATSILDLGCGTGNHDLCLLRLGYRITGVDRSPKNIEIARSKTNEINTGSGQVQYYEGDIRQVRLKEEFDVVHSLFHVMSYLVDNDDLIAAFENVKLHLKKDGLFIFDCWYGPAVMAIGPEARVKKIDNETFQVIRIAEPAMQPNQNIVDVNYHMLIRNKASQKVEEVKETHRMRYWFKPEIEHFLRETGFETIDCREWMTNKDPGLDTWGVYFLARPSD